MSLRRTSGDFAYREQGPSYQQVWNWNPAGNSLQQRTDSPRDHFLPSCSGQKYSLRLA